MPKQPVKGQEAVRRMAGQVLNQSISSQKQNENEEGKDEWEKKAKDARSERIYLEEQKRLDRMSQHSQSQDEENKDPLKEAQKFTKQMAAGAIIESEVAKSKAAAEKATAEAEEAKAKAERAKSGGAENKESPLKVTGSVDLGKFNYQEMLQQQQQDLKDLKKEAEDQAGRQAVVSNELREKLHDKEMEVLKTSFGAQMQVLTKMIETNASKGSFMEQYSAVVETAKTLGYSQPQMAGDLSSQIELKKMEFNQAMELKKMARDERRADREFQRQLNRDADERERELNRDADEREDKKAERAQQGRRDDMIAKTPQYIGGAIAQGLLANQGGGRGVAEEAPPGPTAPKGKQGKQGRHVEAGWGESGEVECPGCSEPVAIGSTARVAVCSNCGEQFPIRRVGEKPVAAQD